jgi:hypothetical protein
MKSKLFAAFGIGALTATVALGAIQFASASGNSTITACANKKTGTMRYISKGKCRKTERTVRWNQQGPQGLPGAKGDTGAVGPKGDAGTAGISGSVGFFKVVDANNRELGTLLSMDEQGYYVLVDGRVWWLRPQESVFFGMEVIYYYADSACQQRLINATVLMPDQWVAIEHNQTYPTQQSPQKAFVKQGNSPVQASSLGNIYIGGRGTGCTLSSSNPLSDEYVSPSDYFYRATEIPMPFSFTAPLTLVEP